jgi:hypothetical protein
MRRAEAAFLAEPTDDVVDEILGPNGPHRANNAAEEQENISMNVLQPFLVPPPMGPPPMMPLPMRQPPMGPPPMMPPPMGPGFVGHPPSMGPEAMVPPPVGPPVVGHSTSMGSPPLGSRQMNPRDRVYALHPSRHAIMPLPYCVSRKRGKRSQRVSSKHQKLP